MAKKKKDLKAQELKALHLGYKVIYEKGTFQSNNCLVRDKKMIVINRLLDDENKCIILTDIISRIIQELSDVELNQEEE
ncbi:MAG TPA: hypothetical protein PK076_10510 [Saprospiraceae bacterium]|nr:hypothetical protein [Saprospiraceae bacterium]HQW56552.1 hypothetical protein [Saprospiraceae bacterium]